MDLKVSQKEKRLQPGVGMVESYVSNVFDLYPVVDGNDITNVELIDDAEEIKQSAMFASIRQHGSDPLSPLDGVHWAEALIGEVSPVVLLTEIRSSVKEVSSYADVAFTNRYDTDGVSYLDFMIEVQK
jgi:hypothetical protein